MGEFEIFDERIVVRIFVRIYFVYEVKDILNIVFVGYFDSFGGEVGNLFEGVVVILYGLYYYLWYFYGVYGVEMVIRR